MSRSLLETRWQLLTAAARKWALRQKRTIASKWFGATTGKVQVRCFNESRRFALWVLGWDVMARLVGDRWQLMYSACDPVAETYTADWIASVC